MNQVDRYMQTLEPNVASILEQVRNIVLSAHPDIRETFKYGMPTYVYRKNIFHFAAAKNHIGLYPTPQPIVAFAGELTTYKTSKGANQIPYDQPFPFDLVKRIIEFQIHQMNKKNTE